MSDSPSPIPITSANETPPPVVPSPPSTPQRTPPEPEVTHFRSSLPPFVRPAERFTRKLRKETVFIYRKILGARAYVKASDVNDGIDPEVAKQKRQEAKEQRKDDKMVAEAAARARGQRRIRMLGRSRYFQALDMKRVKEKERGEEESRLLETAQERIEEENDVNAEVEEVGEEDQMDETENKQTQRYTQGQLLGIIRKHVARRGN